MKIDMKNSKQPWGKHDDKKVTTTDRTWALIYNLSTHETEAIFSTKKHTSSSLQHLLLLLSSVLLFTTPAYCHIKRLAAVAN